MRLDMRICNDRAQSLLLCAEYLIGKQNWQYHLWSVLMFQVWPEVN
jgi:hypothetical protein